MPKGFKYWFGEFDLNNPLHEDFLSAMHEDEAGTSTGPSTGANTGIDPSGHATSFTHGDEAGNSTGPSTDVPTSPDGVDQSNDPPNNRRHGHSNLRSGVTLSSEESGSDGEVQSTPEGYVPQKPFVGMIFDSLNASLAHYKRYAKHVCFLVRIESSGKSTIDGEKG
jgi:hypothetical protein